MDVAPRRRWYHILMKLFYALPLFAASLMAAANPQLKQVNKVYILGMSGGMDQYLASRLTSLGVFQVVADPQKADAVITDRIGESFEARLKELYPPPPPPKPKPVKVEDKAKDDKAKDDKGTADQSAGDKPSSDKPPSEKAKAEPAKDDDKSDSATMTPRVTSFSRGRGNIFIVDPKTSSVLWSIYEPPKNSSPGELSKTAERVVKRLKSDLAPDKVTVE